MDVCQGKALTNNNSTTT